MAKSTQNEARQNGHTNLSAPAGGFPIISEKLPEPREQSTADLPPLSPRPPVLSGDELSWPPHSYPTEGELGGVMQKHLLESLSECGSPDEYRQWLLKVNAIIAWSAAQDVDAAIAAAAPESQAIHSEIMEVRMILLKQWVTAAGALDSAYTNYEMAEKEYVSAAKKLQFPLSSAADPTTSRVDSLRKALDDLAPKRNIVAGRYQKHYREAKTPGDLKIGRFSLPVERLSGLLESAVIPLCFGAISAATIGTAMDFIVPADLNFPGEALGKWGVAWIVGIVMEYRAAHVAADAVEVLSYTKAVPEQPDADGFYPRASQENYPEKIWAYFQAVMLFSILWFLHGRGIVMLTESKNGSMGLSGELATGFFGGGVVTFLYMGGHASRRWLEVVECKTERFLDYVISSCKEKQQGEKEFKEAVAAANHVDAEWAAYLTAQSAVEKAQARWTETFGPNLSQRTEQDIRAAQSAAVGRTSELEQVVKDRILEGGNVG